MLLARVVLAGLALIASSLIGGCSGGSGSSSSDGPPPPVSVAATESTGSVAAGGTVSVNATVTNDPHNEGVTWTLNGPGSLSNPSSVSVTYNAPAEPLASDTVATVVATSKADSSKQTSVDITVLAPVISISTSNYLVAAAGSARIDAQLVNDPSGRGVTWGLSPASGAGTLSDATSTSVTYNAPALPPAGDVPVTITATSAAYSSITAELTVTLLAINVSLSTANLIVPASSTTQVDAHVLSDPSGRGVTWSISPESGAGTLSDATSTSVTYHAPAAAPASDLPVTITGTSNADSSKSGVLAITVPSIKVSVSPTPVLMPIGAQQDYAAQVSYDPDAAGVTWSLTQGGTECSPTCGTVASSDAVSAIYTAPAAVPSDPQVTLIATSTTDHNATGSAALSLTAGTVKLVPSRLVFGRVSTPVAYRAFTLTNTGSTDLAIIGVSITPPGFFFQSNDCGLSVTPAGSCTITVAARTLLSGMRSATVSISDSSPDSPQLVGVSACFRCRAGAESGQAQTQN